MSIAENKQVLGDGSIAERVSSTSQGVRMTGTITLPSGTEIASGTALAAVTLAADDGLQISQSFEPRRLRVYLDALIATETALSSLSIALFDGTTSEADRIIDTITVTMTDYTTAAFGTAMLTFAQYKRLIDATHDGNLRAVVTPSGTTNTPGANLVLRIVIDGSPV